MDADARRLETNVAIDGDDAESEVVVEEGSQIDWAGGGRVGGRTDIRGHASLSDGTYDFRAPMDNETPERNSQEDQGAVVRSGGTVSMKDRSMLVSDALHSERGSRIVGVGSGVTARLGTRTFAGGNRNSSDADGR